MSGGFGRSSQQATATQSRETFVDPSQQPYLDTLRQEGLDLAQSQTGGTMGDVAFGTQNRLQPSAFSGVENLAGINAGQGAEFGVLGDVARSGPGAGQFLLADLSAPGNVDQQIDVLGQRLGEFYNEQLVPGFRNEAIMAGGQLGGSRDQLGRAQAAGEVADAFSTGIADITQRDLGRRGSTAAALGQLEADQLGTRAAAAQASLSERLRAGAALPASIDQAFGLSQAPFAAQFAPLFALSQLIGDPTILATGLSRSQSSGERFSLNFGA